MTSRERWVVYPLLFLTLGITMRDKVWPQPNLMVADMRAFGEVAANKITCKQLDVAHATLRRLDVVQAKCKMVTVTGPSGGDAVRISVGPEGTGRLEVFAADGEMLASVGADEAGGVVTAVGRDGNIWVVMGHFGDQYGVVAESTELDRVMPLTLPWRFETRLPEQQPPEPEASETEPAENAAESAQPPQSESERPATEEEE